MPLIEICQRCQQIDEDRRTIEMDCSYEMSEGQLNCLRHMAITLAVMNNKIDELSHLRNQKDDSSGIE